MADLPRRRHWFGKLQPEENWLQSEENHNSAATAAVKTGCNCTIVALSFDMYKTPRIVQVHRSNTQPIEANR
eukprot:1647293-Heterocapsa_arctica.AAC.1